MKNLVSIIEAVKNNSLSFEDAIAFEGFGALSKVFDNPENPINTELESLLEQSELDSLKTTVIGGYFTPRPVVDAVLKAVYRLGFAGGRVLEPSCGSFRFFAQMDKEIRKNSVFTAVEKDPITAKIASVVAPDAKVINKGFEQVSFPNEYFDLVIGNPPYSTVGLNDVDFGSSRTNLNMDSFFVYKSLKKLRKGGVMAFVMPIGFLDGHQGSALSDINRDCELLAAYRLPQGVFADTEVATDIVLIRKLTDDGVRFGFEIDRIEVSDDAFGVGVTKKVNQYWVENPSHVFARPVAATDRFNKPVVEFKQIPEWQEQLDSLIRNLPSDVLIDADLYGEATQEKIEVSDESIEVFQFGFADDGSLVYRLPDLMDEKKFEVRQASDKAILRIKGMIEIAKILNALIAAENADIYSGELVSLREDLNKAYDSFVKKFGAIHSRANDLAFRDDIRYPLIQSLELDYDKGISREKAKKEGVPYRKPSWKKADIFSKRVNGLETRQAKIETVLDACLASLRATGEINPLYSSTILGMGEKEFINQALEEGYIFHNPESNGFIWHERYLSGDVKTKLETAQNLVAKRPELERNITALEEVLPPKIEAVDIHIPLNARWIPSHIMKAFIEDLFAIEFGEFDTLEVVNDNWVLQYSGQHTVEMQEYGTDYRNAIEILKRALNNTPQKITQKQPDGSTIELKEESLKAQQKAKAMAQAWGAFWLDNVEFANELESIYNEKFNRHSLREDTGSFLAPDGVLPNQNPHIKLDSHQLDAIWKNIKDGNNLFDMVVGAGKTFSAVASIMEQKRMGILSKALVAVPNHLVTQFASEARELYPSAKILATSKRDFDKKNRARFLAKIALCEWDIVVMGHSTFELIPLDSHFSTSFLEESIAELVAAKSSMENTSNRIGIKKIEKAIAAAETRIKKLQNQAKKDRFLTFDKLGVDFICVDESHIFKNLYYATNYTDVAGLGPQEGSQRAFDLFSKVQWLKRKNNGRGVLFLSGTVISNSLVEMFTAMRYFMYEDMKRQGIHTFDAWAAVFSKPETGFEMGVGGTYKQRTRFKSFESVPELLALYKNFAYVVTDEQMKELELKRHGKPLRPPMRTGKPISVILPRSEAQAEIMDELIDRAENLSGKSSTEDNMLKIYHEANLASLDQRLINYDLGDHETSKVQAVVNHAFAEYVYWHEHKGTQLIFCDTSTPSEGFNLYDAIKDGLVEKGIPAEQIAFIHDANTDLQKRALFEKVNSGEIRILLASTAKAGAGTNVQKRLVALHHVDCPFTPSSLTQRNGRIIRRGNELYEKVEGFEVSIYQYGVEMTLDASRFQLVETKARFIDQLKTADLGTRSVSDVESETANLAQMKAALSGNPLILQQVETEKQLKELSAEYQQFVRTQHRYKQFLSATQDFESEYQAQMKKIREAKAAIDLEAGFVAFDGIVVKDKKDKVLTVSAQVKLAISRYQAEYKRKHGYLPTSMQAEREYHVFGTFNGIELSFYPHFSGKWELGLEVANLYQKFATGAGEGFSAASLIEKAGAFCDEILYKMEKNEQKRYEQTKVDREKMAVLVQRKFDKLPLLEYLETLNNACNLALSQNRNEVIAFYPLSEELVSKVQFDFGATNEDSNIEEEVATLRPITEEMINASLNVEEVEEVELEQNKDEEQAEVEQPKVVNMDDYRGGYIEPEAQLSLF